MNSTIVTYELSDWMGNVIGVYDTLYSMELGRDKVVMEDKNVRIAKDFYDMVTSQLADAEVTQATEKAIEALENQVYEDLFMVGKDSEGQDVVIEW